MGGERLTTQLVDVFVNGGKYSFGFDKLIRWIEICKRAGVEYYEMAHLFTQWGALYTPKIMATVDGTYKRIFGWDVSATSDEYKAFVAEYLPALREVLRQQGIEQNTYFHISDEPSGEHIEAYKAARKVVEPYLKGCIIMDALSEYAFYESGAVTKPVPANNAIEPFFGAQGARTVDVLLHRPIQGREQSVHGHALGPRPNLCRAAVQIPH